MRIELDNAAKQPVEIPDRNLIGVLQPNDCCPFHDTDAALKQAAEACAAFLGESQRVLVLVNDYTRPTPNAPVLAALDSALRDRDVKHMVCLGTHRPPTDAEYATIFGSDFLKSPIVCHDSKDKARLFFLGKTSFGTDVWLNKELLWADKVITINSIEPHYFAGYTGGRKGFLPGIAGYDTITRNHNMVTRPGSQTFGLEGNPVHEDMNEAAKMLPRPVFSIQLVQDRNHRLLSIRSGDLFDSFSAATQDAHTVFAVPVKEKADIVLSVLGPPSNINFYQSQRAVEFARPLLKNPAVHITVSACFDDVGNDSFIQVFKGCKSPSDILACGRMQMREPPRTPSSPRPDSGNLQSEICNLESEIVPCPPQSPIPNPQSLSVLGWHKSARLAQIMQTADLYTVVGIDDKVVKSVFMHPFKTAQAALDAAFAKLPIPSLPQFRFVSNTG
ncbi:MAG: nickel-dependent lactate racemase [candidate division WOR-3 bacterium]|nr:nickel-dependent lactate racemase [candidate division WOR-3 bacterium]